MGLCPAGLCCRYATDPIRDLQKSYKLAINNFQGYVNNFSYLNTFENGEVHRGRIIEGLLYLTMNVYINACIIITITTIIKYYIFTFVLFHLSILHIPIKYPLH